MTIARARRRLALVEATLAGLAGGLAMLTIFWSDWIEALTGWDPDRHDGSVEVALITVLAVAAVVVGVIARHTWRTAAHAAS